MVQPKEGQIGPNAVIRLAVALRARGLDPEPIFVAAGLATYVDEPPTTMVPEDDVSRLYASLHTSLPTTTARDLAFEAGERTGTYLLENRIPKLAQAVLKLLPARLSASLLLTLIERHAWTFAGSAELSITRGNPVYLRFAGSPLCRHIRASEPVCDFYCGTFRRLFRELVARESEVDETACAGRGDDACLVEIRW